MIVRTFAPLPSGCQCAALFLPLPASLAAVPFVQGHRKKEGVDTDAQTQALHLNHVEPWNAG